MGQLKSKRQRHQVIRHQELADDDENEGVETADLEDTFDFPFLKNEDTIFYIKGSKVLILLRGLPGSGKSHLARKIQETFQSTCTLYSADDYFTTPNGGYKFNPDRLKDAHVLCQQSCRTSLEQCVPVVVVDNTNVKQWEMNPYIDMAKQNAYVSLAIEPKTSWRKNPQQLAERNKHSVSREKIQMRLDQWEDANHLYFGWFLNDADSRNLVSISRAYLNSCWDIPEFRKQFEGVLRNFRVDNLEQLFGITTKLNERFTQLHCTSLFCGGNTSKRRNYLQKSAVEQAYGVTSDLHIVGFVVTEKTFGARVKLTDAQLRLWGQDDTEKGPSVDDLSKQMKNMDLNKSRGPNKNSKGPQNRNSGQQAAASNNLKDRPLRSIPTLASFQRTDNELEISWVPTQGPGCRAHITLGTVRGCKPVQTGFDLIQVIKNEGIYVENNTVPTTFAIQGADVYCFENFLWTINLKREIRCKTLFASDLGIARR